MHNNQFEKAKHAYPARGPETFRLNRTDSCFRQRLMSLSPDEQADVSGKKPNYQFQVNKKRGYSGDRIEDIIALQRKHFLEN